MSSQNDPASGSDDKFLDNHDMLKTGLSDPAVVALNIRAEDQAQIKSDNDLLNATKSADDITFAAAQKSTKNKNNVFATGKSNYRAIRQRIMKSPGYTPAIGELLGLERPQSATAGVTLGAGAPPVLHGAALVTGGAQIKVIKGSAEAVDLYCQRDGDATAVLLQRVMHFPYVDSRPLLVAGKPERRAYHGVFVRMDQPYGDPSAVLTVIVSA